jgi:hypothetical protein
MQKRNLLMFTGVVTTVALMASVQAEQEHAHSMQLEHRNAGAAVTDPRTVVHFPKRMRAHILANMRDHLLALSEIQQALSQEEFEKAGEIAERRLGMSAMRLHGANEASQYMPNGMAAIGAEMHRAASRFAVAASDAAVEDDVKPALAALSEVTRQCVACHSGFRVL